ncbi:MAG: 50S ribosomal protein L10 [Candidatus Falkowbacteria bacterium]
MPKTKEQKRDILHNIKSKVDQAKSVVFAKFDKLTVKENEDLRQKLDAENSEYYVAKKTLLSLVFKDKNIAGLDIRSMEGRVAAIFGYNDEVAPAKIVGLFKKTHADKLDFVGGILEDRYLTPDQVEALSKLPGKQELYARLVGSINAPVSGFVNALAGNLRNLVYVLKAIEEKKS